MDLTSETKIQKPSKTRRSKFDIIAEIITNSTGGIPRTHLVYSTNLNFTLLKKYLRTLSERGFVESKSGTIYATKRGLEFLEKYKELQNLYESNIKRTQSTY